MIISIRNGLIGSVPALAVVSASFAFNWSHVALAIIAALFALAGFVFGLTNTIARIRATIFFVGLMSLPALLLVAYPYAFALWLVATFSGIAVWRLNPLSPPPGTHIVAGATGGVVASLLFAVAIPFESMKNAQRVIGGDDMQLYTAGPDAWLVRILMLAAGIYLATVMGKSVAGLSSEKKKDHLVKYRQEPENRAAIVFIHGFLGDARDTWESLVTQMKKIPQLDDWDIYSFGYSTSLNLEFELAWSRDPDLLTVTNGLRTLAKHSTTLNRYETYAIAAHSMGGLITQRALLDDKELQEQVDVAMVFGTPSAGRSAQGLGFLNRQVATMDPKGKFITRLRRDWDQLWATRKPRFAFYSVAGLEDNFIQPSTSHDPFPEEQRRVVPGDHLDMIEAQSPDDDVVQLVTSILTRTDETAPPWLGAQLAIERGEFHDAIDTLSAHVAELDSAALRKLALAYASTGQNDKAREILEQHLGKAGTDGMGILGGQFKRRWMLEGRQADAERAEELYGEAYEISKDREDHDQAYYHAINLAFLCLLYDREPNKAREWAAAALDHCSHTEESVWRTATEAEAHLYLGDYDAAAASYAKVMARGTDHVRPAMAHSMYQQAQAIAKTLNDRQLADRIDTVFVPTP